MTYQPQSGNGDQPMPQTYPQVQSSPPGPSPQMSPMSAPRQAQPIPSPLATTPPPPDYYQQAPAPTGPPALRALQGQLRNPVPIILAGIGLLLVGAAFFTPLAEYTWQGEPERDPLLQATDQHFATLDNVRRLGLNLGAHPAIPLLLVVVAAAIAMAGSRNWLVFGRLAAIGLGGTAVAAALGMASEWKTTLQGSFDRMVKLGWGEDEFDGEPSSAARELLDNISIDFGAGLWLLIAGVAALVAATLAIRTHGAPPAPMTQQRTAYPQVNQVAPHSYQATQAQPPAQPVAASQAPATGAGDRDVVVHDDPPSLSIYKPPKKES